METYRNWKNRIILAVKGMAMGTADMIPGVSGGAIALISGIYDHFIQALSSVKLTHALDLFQAVFGGSEKKSQARKNLSTIEWNFLLTLAAGIVIAIAIMSRLIPVLLEQFPFYTYSFFFGLILVSISIPYRHMKHGFGEYALILLFALFAFWLTGLQHSESGNANPLFLFFSGFVAISAMVLPGISGSYILAVLGEYSIVLEALHEFHFAILIPFLLGIAGGILGFIPFLRFLLQKAHSLTMAALTGLLVGSLRAMWPYTASPVELYPASPHLFAVIFIAIGAVAILALEFASKKSGP